MVCDFAGGGNTPSLGSYVWFRTYCCTSFGEGSECQHHELGIELFCNSFQIRQIHYVYLTFGQGCSLTKLFDTFELLAGQRLGIFISPPLEHGES